MSPEPLTLTARKVIPFHSDKYAHDILILHCRATNGSFCRVFVDPQNRNYARWQPIVQSVENHTPIMFTDAHLLANRTDLIDADSPIRIVKPDSEQLGLNLG